MERGAPGRRDAYGAALVVLVAVQPFIAFGNRNRGQITQPSRVLLYAVAVATIALVALLVAERRWPTSPPSRKPLVVAVIVASFLNFSALFDTDPTDAGTAVASLVVWLIVTGLVVRLAQLAGGNPEVRLAVLIFAAVLLLVPAVSWTAYEVGDPPLLPISDPGELRIPAQRPNVYWLVLDGYARPDVLRDVVGFDDRPFVSDLEALGLAVSSSSRTSYPRTHLSLASTLEMRYVLEPGHDIADDFGRFGPVVVGHNSVAARFSALGYQTIYGAAGGLEWSACREDLVDVCLPLRRPSPSTGELEQSLLDLTPLGVVALPISYSDPEMLADSLEDEELGVEPPYFVFEHILSPHFPYRYRSDCTARAVPQSEVGESRQERLDSYRTQVRCINDRVAAALEAIVDRDPTAIVVLQSDHGSEITFRFGTGPDSWTAAQVGERYAAFNAMRLPERCRADVDDLALVNTFRIVFACIEGTEPELLDYRAFGMSLDDVSALSELGPELLVGVG